MSYGIKHKNLLKGKCRGLLIWRFGSINYFVWQHMKCPVHKDKPVRIPALEDIITHAIGSIILVEILERR